MDQLDPAPSSTVASTRLRWWSNRMAGVVGRAAASKAVTGGLLGVYALQAAAVALVARRSIYDEDHHMDAIGYFASGATPFEQQPEGLNNVGDLSRYGSYLHHWIFGVVQRATEAMGVGSYGSWMVLRLLTVAMMTAGLWFVWAAVREMGGGRGAANLTLALLVLTPLHVYVASIVNYDGMVMPLAYAAVYLALTIYNRPFSAARWIALAVVVVAALLTKVAVVPFLAVLVGLLVVWQASVGRDEVEPGVRAFVGARGRTGTRNLVLALVLLLAVVAFTERFVVNVVRYGSLEPACEDVQSAETCEAYPPWRRNRDLALHHEKAPLGPSAATTFFSRHWVPQMQLNSTMIGVKSTQGMTSSYGPHITGWVVWAGTPVLLAAVVVGTAKHGVGRGAWVVVGAVVSYVGSLFLFNLQTFLRYGIPIAVQARYLLLVLPFVFALLAIRLSRSLPEARNGSAVALGLALLLALGATQGGGALSFFYSSDPTWWNRSDGFVHWLASSLASVADRLVIPDSWVGDPRLPGS